MAGDGSTPGLDGLAAGVPPELRPAFERAQHFVEQYFAERRVAPIRGTIEVAGERYILVRGGSLSTEFFDLIAGLYEDRAESEAREVASGFLYDLAHAIGKADARRFHTKMGLDTPVDRLSAGPLHFAFTGWARVEISPLSRPSPDDEFFLLYEHPNSFECDAWISQDRDTETAVCVMNAGYSSGWCAESFGISLGAVEVACRAKGDAECTFIMAPPHRLAERVAEWAHATGFEIRDDHRPMDFFRRARREDELRLAKYELEAMVRSRTDELVKANTRLRAEVQERRQVEDMRQQLETKLRDAQKLEAVGTLAGGIAHDFNNLLTTITVGLELAAMDVTEPQSAGAIEDARRAARSAADLVQRLLTVGRREKPRMAATDLERLVRRAAALLRRSMPANIRVSVTLEDSLPWIKVDSGQLEQALLNLGLNAKDAMPEGGRLDFRISAVDLQEADLAEHPEGQAGRFVCIEARDEGDGIEPEHLDRIFDPFFTTKPPNEGSGLGLSMAYASMKAHGGWIEVDSTPGEGARFSLYIPWSEAPAAERGAQSATLPRGTETILLVDDAEGILRQSRTVLELCGYKVLVASDGLDALAGFSANEAEIDLVVTDLVMPRMDGRGLLSRLRTLGATQPVMLVSGFLPNTSVAELLQDGFIEVVRKPYDALSFARAVRRAIDTHGQTKKQ